MNIDRKGAPKDDSEDNLRPEYEPEELAKLLKTAVRGKYVEQYRKGTNVVKLAPDVSVAFPTEEAVDAALRKVMAEQKVAT